MAKRKSTMATTGVVRCGDRQLAANKGGLPSSLTMTTTRGQSAAAETIADVSSSSSQRSPTTVDRLKYKGRTEEITSPLSAQLLEFCESELFPETAAAVQISEVGSSSNCCYEEHSSHSTGLSHTQDMSKLSGGAGAEKKNDEIATAGDNTTAATAGDGAANNNNNFSVFFDPQEDDISRSIDFNFSIPPQFLLDGQFDLSLFNGQGPVPNGGGQYPPEQPAGQLIPPPLPQPYEEECLSSVPSSYMPSCSILDYLPLPLPAENSGVFAGGAMFQPQELDFQADNNGSRSLFCPDTISRPYNFSNDLQAVSSESQHLVSGAGSTSTPLASDITSLEDSTFKVGKLSVEQRKEKIHRYLKKRNERNFSKKIKISFIRLILCYNIHISVLPSIGVHTHQGLGRDRERYPMSLFSECWCRSISLLKRDEESLQVVVGKTLYNTFKPLKTSIINNLVEPIQILIIMGLNA
nr:two-component response regulator-like APRR5 [Ipomoea batatas]